MNNDKTIISLIEKAVVLSKQEINVPNREAFRLKNCALLNELNKMLHTIQTQTLDTHLDRIPALKYIVSSDPQDLIDTVNQINELYNKFYFTGMQNNYQTTKEDEQMIELIDKAINNIKCNMFSPMPDYFQRNEALIESLNDMRRDVLYGKIDQRYSIIREMRMLTDADSKELVDLIIKINEFYKQNYKKH